LRRFADAYCNCDGNAHSYGHANCDCSGYSDCYGYSDSDSNAYAYAYSDANRGETVANAAAATDITAAASLVGRQLIATV